MNREYILFNTKNDVDDSLFLSYSVLEKNSDMVGLMNYTHKLAIKRYKIVSFRWNGGHILILLCNSIVLVPTDML